jgi:hypothetical protein
MGYRSTVAFIISFKDKETLDNYLAPRLLDENLKQYRDSFERISWDDASALYYTEDVKWYDDYKDVQALTRLYKDAVDAGGAYRFIRIGEDMNDVIDETGESEKVEPFSDDFHTVTSIQLPPTLELFFGEEQ